MAEASSPRDAATVLMVLRSADGSTGVLLQKRHTKLTFMGGAHVFPGGRVDAADALVNDDWQRPLHWPQGFDAAHARAACREVHEETGLVITPHDLVPWARWLTPSVEPKRFDTRFFFAQAPADQTPVNDDNESVDLRFWDPNHAVEAHARGDIFLPPPTLLNIVHISRGHVSPPSPSFPTILPRLRMHNGEIQVIMPWAADYDQFPGDGHPLSREEAGELAPWDMFSFPVKCMP